MPNALTKLRRLVGARPFRDFSFGAMLMLLVVGSHSQHATCDLRRLPRTNSPTPKPEQHAENIELPAPQCGPVHAIIPAMLWRWHQKMHP
jgi:hypothetical protein